MKKELNQTLKLWISCFVVDNKIDTTRVIIDKDIEVLPGKILHTKATLQDLFDYFVSDEDEAFQSYAEPYLHSFMESSDDIEDFYVKMGNWYEDLTKSGIFLL